MFLEILLSLVTVSFFSLLALRPTLITIAELIKEIESKKEIVATMDEKIENLARAQTLYDKEIKRVRLLETSIPREPSPDAFIRQVEGLSSKHTVGLLSMSTSKVTLLGQDKSGQPETVDGAILGTTGEVNFAMRVSADYPELFNFLTDVEKMRRPIKLTSLSLSLSRTEQGTTLVLVMDGKTPYMKEAQENLAQ